jgi:hypothetical protein
MQPSLIQQLQRLGDSIRKWAATPEISKEDVLDDVRQWQVLLMKTVVQDTQVSNFVLPIDPCKKTNLFLEEHLHAQGMVHIPEIADERVAEE